MQEQNNENELVLQNDSKQIRNRMSVAARILIASAVLALIIGAAVALIIFFPPAGLALPVFVTAIVVKITAIGLAGGAVTVVAIIGSVTAAITFAFGAMISGIVKLFTPNKKVEGANSLDVDSSVINEKVKSVGTDQEQSVQPAAQENPSVNLSSSPSDSTTGLSVKSKESMSQSPNSSLNRNPMSLESKPLTQQENPPPPPSAAPGPNQPEQNQPLDNKISILNHDSNILELIAVPIDSKDKFKSVKMLCELGQKLLSSEQRLDADIQLVVDKIIPALSEFLVYRRDETVDMREIITGFSKLGQALLTLELTEGRIEFVNDNIVKVLINSISNLPKASCFTLSQLVEEACKLTKQTKKEELGVAVVDESILKLMSVLAENPKNILVQAKVAGALVKLEQAFGESYVFPLLKVAETIYPEVKLQESVYRYMYALGNQHGRDYLVSKLIAELQKTTVSIDMRAEYATSLISLVVPLSDELRDQIFGALCTKLKKRDISGKYNVVEALGELVETLFNSGKFKFLAEQVIPQLVSVLRGIYYVDDVGQDKSAEILVKLVGQLKERGQLDSKFVNKNIVAKLFDKVEIGRDKYEVKNSDQKVRLTTGVLVELGRLYPDSGYDNIALELQEELKNRPSSSNSPLSTPLSSSTDSPEELVGASSSISTLPSSLLPDSSKLVATNSEPQLESPVPQHGMGTTILTQNSPSPILDSGSLSPLGSSQSSTPPMPESQPSTVPPDSTSTPDITEARAVHITDVNELRAALSSMKVQTFLKSDEEYDSEPEDLDDEFGSPEVSGDTVKMRDDTKPQDGGGLVLKNSDVATRMIADVQRQYSGLVKSANITVKNSVEDSWETNPNDINKEVRRKSFILSKDISSVNITSPSMQVASTNVQHPAAITTTNIRQLPLTPGQLTPSSIAQPQSDGSPKSTSAPAPAVQSTQTAANKPKSGGSPTNVQQARSTKTNAQPLKSTPIKANGQQSAAEVFGGKALREVFTEAHGNQPNGGKRSSTSQIVNAIGGNPAASLEISKPDVDSKQKDILSVVLERAHVPQKQDAVSSEKPDEPSGI